LKNYKKYEGYDHKYFEDYKRKNEKIYLSAQLVNL